MPATIIQFIEGEFYVYSWTCPKCGKNIRVTKPLGNSHGRSGMSLAMGGQIGRHKKVCEEDEDDLTEHGFQPWESDE